MKILVVEDSESMLLLLTTLLEQFGYSVTVAKDGQQAWEILQQRKDIHLVLTDWNMPNMDGIALCQTIRNAQFSHYIYIILLTGKGDIKTAVVEGMEAGADDFLTKPVDRNELRVRLNAGQRILNLEQTLDKRHRALQESNHKLQQLYEQMREELQSAAEMQKALLPLPGILSNIRFDWLFYPSRFVAGDMFGFFELDEEHLGFYQLDVTGHNVRSALLSFTVHYRLAHNPTQACDLLLYKVGEKCYPLPPNQVLYRLNNLFQSDTDSLLHFTLIYGYIHKVTREVQFSQAGHPRPIYLSHQTAETKVCGSGGLPIGMLPDMNYGNTHLSLQRGDRLFIYSDGITECQNNNGDLFSEARLLRLITETCETSLELSLKEVGKVLSAWHGKEAFEDDVSLLAIEVV